MKRRHLAHILPWILYSFSAIADSSMIKQQSQGDVTFISGGIGGDERDALQAVRADYNLALLFSMQGTGEYFSDVTVSISDAKRQSVLDTVSDGPMLFAKLKPGRYRVSADHEGQVINKNVTVDRKHRSALSFTWSGQ
ncbi:carboxypeptidase regulatory-like domain-containing protein [Methylomonas montana]|uniref:carboxypeptidase regulatory-like domain-containing protein n=1 Tax=Methylomonas montana TaxID=3058963 RepID=UPI002659E9C3|nr:carboxypeptidase regulatory-like domain-containing protein [Methylomonas montana]WKJ92280.1 carboxypeptidase regulatory-like domain-containing protein [Methylomonas montana]